MKVDKLTDKQRRFITEYVQSLNATQAAIAAGYSENGASVRGHELLRNSKVRAAINEMMAELSMSPQEIIYRLTAQAMGDIAEILDPATMSVDLKKAKAGGNSHLIKKVKDVTITTDEQEQHITEVEMHDSQRALYYLGKIHALFTDKLEVRTWQSEAVDAIKRKEITFESLEAELGHSLAAELFQQAGVAISSEA